MGPQFLPEHPMASLLIEQTFAKNKAYASEVLTRIPSLKGKQTIVNTERKCLFPIPQNQWEWWCL